MNKSIQICRSLQEGAVNGHLVVALVRGANQFLCFVHSPKAVRLCLANRRGIQWCALILSRIQGSERGTHLCDGLQLLRWRHPPLLPATAPHGGGAHWTATPSPLELLAGAAACGVHRLLAAAAAVLAPVAAVLALA